MRYYVLCVSDEPGVLPYILAEVVRDSLAPDDDRELSLAGTLAGPRSVVATRDELLTGGVGQAALTAWDNRDDAEFDHETNLLEDRAEAGTGVRLRLVWNTSAAPPPGASKDGD
jgi:hypothetical protein